jgi:hypothetical protein
MTPTMLEYVREQAQEKGVSVVDWVRFAIAFAFWEEDFVRNYERWQTLQWEPESVHHDFAHLSQFETVYEKHKQAWMARLEAQKQRP